MRAFCADLTVTKAAHLLTLNQKTVNKYYQCFSTAIYDHQVRAVEELIGVLKYDERYFGADRMRGKAGPRKRGRGTKEQAVFGVLERRGRVFTELIPDAKAKTLQGVI